jgi:peroxiredoxin
VRKIYEDIRQLDGEVLAVTMSRPETLAAFLNRDALPFPLLADPDREAYRAFGLKRISWWTLLAPGVIGRYLKLMFSGWLPTKRNQEDDLLQLGGDFVLDRNLRLVYAHRSSDPTGQASAEQLLDAVRQVANAAK